MATIPSAGVTIDAEAGALAGGTGYCVVMGCVPTSADTTPRVFSSAKSLLATHGYSPAVDYAALHLEATKQPVLFIGLPASTPGASANLVTTGKLGTSVFTVTGTIFEETSVIFTVVNGGTIAANGITFTLSLDGGRTSKLIRLGTAVSYTVPYVGIILNFAAGTLLAGDVVTFTTTAPMWGSSDISAARVALASQQKLARSWVVIGDITNSTFAGYVTTAANAYASSNDRFTYARVNVSDKTSGETTQALFVAARVTAFATVDGQRRIDLGLGRARVTSPITAWAFRRPAMWAISIREYQKDIHIPTWRKSDGPLDGWSIEDTNGNIVEYDERTIGGALADRFSCLRTWGNGPNGVFVAMSLTRDTEGSLLSYTHNMAVANLACTIVQKATENVVGKVLQLKDDGTATTAALSRIEESINTDLEQSLMVEKVIGQGPRASKAVWRASTTDVLNVANATLTGVLDLHLNGTVVHVTTVVKVS